jgi:hypothetical protein
MHSRRRKWPQSKCPETVEQSMHERSRARIILDTARSVAAMAVGDLSFQRGAGLFGAYASFEWCENEFMSYDLDAAVEHVVHDYSYLMVAGHDTQNSVPSPCNHYAERTFLVHCRVFAGFFSDGKDSRDMYARDFVDTMPQVAHPEWDRWHDHIDKHLMHLTKARVINKVPWTGAPNKIFLAEFRQIWKDFYAALKPSLKPIFDRELALKQAQMPQVRLT